MGIFNFATGFGNAYDGFNQQTQVGIDRANAAEDRDYMRTQRAVQANLQQHQTDALAREDQERTANQNAPAVGSTITTDGVTPAADGGSDDVTDPSSVNAQNGNDVAGGWKPAPTPAPTQQIVTPEMDLRTRAANAKAAGNSNTYLDLSAKADQLGMIRSAKQFQALKSSIDPATATPLQIAQGAKEIYNNDPMPGQITNIEDIGNGGARVTFLNKQTGGTMTRDFKQGSGQQIMDTLEGLYSPDSMAQRQKAMFDMHMKVLESQALEQSKPLKARIGEMVQPGVGDPRVPMTNTNFRPVANAAGAGKPVDPNPDLTTALKNYDFIATKGDTKLQPEVAAAGRALIQPIMDTYKQRTGQSLPSTTAVDVALRASAHPELIKPEIDPSTGTFVSSITDSQGHQFVLPNKVQVDPTTNLPAGLTPQDASAKVGDMLKTMGTVAPAFVTAAADKTGAAGKALVQQAQDQIKAKVIASPVYQQASPAQQQAMLSTYYAKANELVSNQLALISQFGPKPAAPARPASSWSLPKLKPAGGLPSGGGGSIFADDDRVGAERTGAF